ncbi:MAG: hypothetical protein MUE42_01025 [Opitutaceae bacterium]|nr:hypothetical protein [Opitutaceae bacterium]
MPRLRSSLARLLAFLFWVFLPVFAGAQTLRLNELAIAGAEFVELDYTGFSTPQNLSGYALVTAGPGASAGFALPSFTLSGSGRVVVYTGAGVASGNVLYLGRPGPILADGGDSVLIRRLSDSAAIDYFSWGSEVAAPPSPLVFATSYNTGDGFYAPGDSLAYIGTNPDLAAHWINRRGANITPGAANTVQTPPTFAYNVAAPADIDSCELIPLALTFTHTDEAPLRGTTLSFTLPAGFLYASASDGGVFNNATRTVTWTLPVSLAANTFARTVGVRPDTAVTSGAFPAGNLAYSYSRYVGGPAVPGSGANAVDPFAVARPDLSVSVADFSAPSQPYIITQGSGVVALLVRVANAGPGELAGDGATVALDLPANLSLLTARIGGPTGSSVLNLVSNLATQEHSFSTGVIAAGASRDFYIQARVDGCGDLSPVIDVSFGCSDAAPGAVTSEIALPTVTFPIYCDVELAISYPSGTYTAGQPIPVSVTLTNRNNNALDPAGLVLAFHPGFFVDSIKRSGLDVGVYDPAALPEKTITFSAADLGGVLAGNSTTTLDIVLRPSPSLPNDRKFTASLGYTVPALGPTPVLPVTRQSLGVQAVQPGLTVSLEDPAAPGSTTVLASRGDDVLFLVTVLNNGAGNLNQDGPDPDALPDGAFVEIAGTGGALNILQVRDVTGLAGPYTPTSGVPVALGVNPANSRQRWNTGAVNAGPAGAKRYILVVSVEDCVGLEAELDSYWSVQGALLPAIDTATVSAESAGSVDIVLRTPELSIVAPAFTVDYCAGVSTSVTFANAAGAGPVRNLVAAVTGLNLTAYDVVVTSGNFTFTPSYANPGHPADGRPAFVLIGGQDTDGDGDADDLDAAASAVLTYQVSVKTGGVACSPAGAGLVYQPYYEDDCNIPWTAGTRLSSYGVTTPPGIASDFDGPDFADVNASGLTYDYSFRYRGAPGAPFRYTLVIAYPLGFAYASVTPAIVAPSILTHNALARTVTVEIDDVFDASGDYAADFAFLFDAPTDNCAAGQSYTFTYNLTVTDPADPTDCNDCPQTEDFNGSQTTTLNNDDEDAIVAHNREVTYLNTHLNGDPITHGAAETCTELVIDHYLRFSPSAPANWFVNVSGVDRPLVFDETFFNNYGIPNGNLADLQLEVYYFASAGTPSAPSGPNYGPTGSGLVSLSDINNLSPTGEGFDRVKIDLDGLQALGGPTSRPNDGGWLWFRYRMAVKSNTTLGGTIEFADLEIPVLLGLCNADDKNEFRQAVVLNAARSAATVSIANVSGSDSRVVDRCEPVTFRLEIGNQGSTPFDLYDTRVVLDLGNINPTTNRWAYDPATAAVSFVGLKNAATNTPLAAFAPVVSGPNDSILTWNLGDLREAYLPGTYIELTLNKSCDEAGTALSAIAYSRDRCANAPDLGLPSVPSATGGGNFTTANNASYAPSLDEGVLSALFTTELVYYNDGYPRIRFDVVNSGNGDLYNVKIPVRLGDNARPLSLSYVSSRVAKVAGAVTFPGGGALTTGANFPAWILGTEDDAVPVVAGADDAEREVVFSIGKLPSGALVTVEVTLRMHLCQDLFATILPETRWGCLGSACGANIETTKQRINIAQGNTRVFVLEHSADPAVLDFCGSRTRFTMEIVNVGAVDVYEPIIREQLPPGLTLVPDSVRYAVDSGSGYGATTYDAMTPFPGGGSRYTSLTGTGSAASPQVITWNFTDPDDDDSESDSLLVGAAHLDSRPTDPNFTRHRVLRPGQRIRVMFDAELVATGDCANALAYFNSDRKAEATILFDLPCNHDNTVTASGSPASPSPRGPLNADTRDSNFLDPGAADVLLALAGQNTTQAAALTTAQVNGETGDTVEWTFTIESLGPGVVPDASLQVFLPSNLTFVSAAIISGPSNITLDTATPAPVAEPGGARRTFTFNNTNPFMIAQGRADYLDASGTITIKIVTTINTCAEDLVGVEGTFAWGCCQGVPGLEDANGSVSASVDVKTVPDAPVVSLASGPMPTQVAFSTCGGYLDITLVNPSTNRELSLRDFDLAVPVPTGFAYDASIDGATWTYSLTGGGVSPRVAAAAELTPAEEEPQIDGSFLRWRSQANSGLIPAAKARLFPRETVVIRVYFKLQAGGPYCDTNPDSDPSIPNFNQLATFNHTDSCGNQRPVSLANLSIDPRSPNLNVAITPVSGPAFITASTTTVEWTLTLQNAGDAPAGESALLATFGAGYTGVSITPLGGAPAPTSSSGNTFTWDRGDLPVLSVSGSSGDTLQWRVTATVNTVSRGDLSGVLDTNGWCLDRAGNDVCNYSLDTRRGYVSGGTIEKVIDGLSLSAPAVSTPAANDPAAKTADLTIGSIVRHLITVELFEGGATDLRVEDLMPAGFVFLEASARRGVSGGWTALTNSGTGQRLVFTGQPILNAITGAATVVDGDALYVEVWSRVGDLAANASGGSKVNTATLTINRGTGLGAISYTHDSPAGVDLRDTTTITLIEPELTSPTKTSVPASGTSGTPNVINLATDPASIAYTLTVENTGDAPAYETVLIDAVPFGLVVSSATVTRNAEAPLVLDTHYTFAFVAGVGGNPGTLTVTLLDQALAVLAPNDVLTVAYTASIAGAAPGQELFNLATFNTSSLPGTGAAKTTARGTAFLEADDERTAYLTAEVRTFHQIFGVLERSKGVKNELTLAAGAAAADTYRFPPDATTRATIGELVTYQARLKLPPFVTIYDLRFQDTVPDGLTVRSIKWELVPRDGALTVAALDIPIPAQSSGATPINHLHSSTTNPFPGSLNGGSTPGSDLLVEITATVDQQLNGGTAIAAQSFANTATFSWGDFSGDTTRTTLATDAVSFSVLVPNILPASVTKIASEYRREDGATVFTPSTVTVVNRLSGTPTFRGINDNANATGVPVVAPGEFVQYRVRVVNSGTTTAYAVQVYDVVPRTTVEDFAVGAPYGLEYTDFGGLLPPSVVASSGTSAILTGPAFVQNELTLTLDQVAAGATVDVFFWMRVRSDVAASLHFGNRARVLDYRTLPAAGVAFPAEARTSSSTPAFAAIPFAAARDVGLATAAPVFTTTFQSDITDPSPDTALSVDTGRATIGEEVVLRQTIDLPAGLALYEWRPRNNLTGHDVDAWVVPSGLTVRRVTFTFGADAAIDLPAGNITVNAGSGSTRIARPATLAGAPAGYPDLLATAISTPGGEPEFTLTVYATVNGDSLAATPIRITNGSGSATIVDAGDTLSLVPVHRWAQWDGITANLNQAAAPTRAFGIVEPGITNVSFTKTRLTAATSGTGVNFTNFYGEGPLALAPQNPVPSVPLFTDGDVITYRIQYTNSGTAPAYGIEVIDRIPAGLTFNPASPVVTSETGGTGTLTAAVIASAAIAPTDANYSTNVRFTVDRLDVGETVQFTYTATVNDPVAVGRYLQNRADLSDYSTLPAGYVSTQTPATAGVVEANERDTDSANPYVDRGPVWAFAGIADNNVSSKTLQTELTAPSGKLSNGTSRATPGELLTYELTVDIPDGRVLHDFYLFDELPDGTTFVPALTSYALNGVTGLTAGIVHDGNRRFGLALGDLAGTAAANELVVTLRATVDLVRDTAATPVVAGATLGNSFTFSWNQVDVDPDPVVNLATDARTTVNSVTVGPVVLQIQEPDLDASLAKTQANVQEAGVIGSPAASRGTAAYYAYDAAGSTVTTVAGVESTLPDDRVVYTLSVTNSGASPAFDIALRDLLPADDGVTYQSGVGTVVAGSALPGALGADFAGSAGSRLTVATSSAVNPAGETATRLDFTIDFLLPGETATIRYVAQVDRGIGAGHYLGANSVNLRDYGSLPAAALAVSVGNLAAGDLVHDNALERDTDSSVAPYAKQGPVVRHLGVVYPTLAKSVFRLYDADGSHVPAAVAADEVLRVGDILRTELSVTLPRYTRLFDGGVSAVRLRDVLPAGQSHLAATVEGVTYPDYNDDTLDLSGFAPAVSTPAASGVQTVNFDFADVVNSTGAALTGTVKFLSDIRPLAADGSDLLASTTGQLSGANVATLFWNTHDTRPQRSTYAASATLNPAADDVPWLRQTGPSVLTRQPNLSLAKTANYPDGSVIGATAGVGDTVLYTVTVSNLAATAFSGPAYEVGLTDNLPRNLAPAALAAVAGPPAANQFSASVGSPARTLVPGDDYTFAYAYDSVTRRGSLSLQTKRDTTGNDYASRIEPGETLTLTYNLPLNPELGAEGSGVGLMANRAQIPAYASFPAGIASTSPKTYDPLGPAVHTLIAPAPTVAKTALAPHLPGSSLTAGDIVTYVITAPAALIRANLYDVEIRDSLPDGMSFVSAGVVTAPAGPAGAPVALDTTPTIPGSEVEVEGGAGDVTITIAPDARSVSVRIDRVDETDGDAAGADIDQVVITLRARVNDTFANGAPIPRLHEFANYAELYWYNSDVTFAARSRFLLVSERVSHYYEAFGLLLEPDNQGTAVPGEVKTYRHLLRNFESGAVDVPLTWSSTLGWNWLAYEGDGQGNVVSGPYAPGDGHLFAVPGDGAIEIIMQAFVPAPATAFTTDVLTLTAFGPPDFAAALNPGDQDISVYDTTTVQLPGVVITKDISDNNGATYADRLLIDPSDPDRVLQRLRFYNNSPVGVRSVYVHDNIPQHTAYVANSAVNTPLYALSYSKDQGQTWLPGEPAVSEPVVGGTVPSVTHLRWLYDGGALLVPGPVHTVTFKLKVK